MLSIEDIESSLWKYLQDNFSTCSIAWQGLEFDTSGVTEWVEPWILAWLVRAYRGTVEYADMLVQVGIFWKPRAVDLYKGKQIAQEIRALLEHANVVIKDYASGDPSAPATVGILKGREAEVINLGEGAQKGVQQVSVSVSFNYCKG